MIDQTSKQINGQNETKRPCPLVYVIFSVRRSSSLLVFLYLFCQ